MTIVDVTIIIVNGCICFVICIVIFALTIIKFNSIVAASLDVVNNIAVTTIVVAIPNAKTALTDVGIVDTITIFAIGVNVVVAVNIIDNTKLTTNVGILIMSTPLLLSA